VLHFYTKKDPAKLPSQLAGQGRKAVSAAICAQEPADAMGFTLEAMKRTARNP